MNERISRRKVLVALMSLPWATLVGCSKEPGASGGGGGGVRIAKKILLPIVRKISLVYDAIVTVNDLVVEIKAMIDGKVETIEARLTKEQAEALSNGGELIIKGEDGTEFPVEHKVK